MVEVEDAVAEDVMEVVAVEVADGECVGVNQFKSICPRS